MKKLTVVLIMISICFSLFSCGNNNGNETEEISEEETEEIIIDYYYPTADIGILSFYEASDNVCVAKLIDFTETENDNGEQDGYRSGKSVFKVVFVYKGNHYIDEIIEIEDVNKSITKNNSYRLPNYRFFGCVYDKEANHYVDKSGYYTLDIGSYYYIFDEPETITTEKTVYKNDSHKEEIIGAKSFLPAAVKYSDSSDEDCLYSLYGDDNIDWDNEHHNFTYYELTHSVLDKYAEVFYKSGIMNIKEQFRDIYIGKKVFCNRAAQICNNVFLGIPISITKNYTVKYKDRNNYYSYCTIYTIKAEVVQSLMGWGTLQKGDIIEFESLIDYSDLNSKGTLLYSFFHEDLLTNFDEETAEAIAKASPYLMLDFDFTEFINENMKNN